MKAYELPCKVTSEGRLELPNALMKLLPANQGDSSRQTSLPLLSSATERQISCHLVISWDACPPSETSYKCPF